MARILVASAVLLTMASQAYPCTSPRIETLEPKQLLHDHNVKSLYLGKIQAIERMQSKLEEVVNVRVSESLKGKHGDIESARRVVIPMCGMERAVGDYVAVVIWRHPEVAGVFLLDPESIYAHNVREVRRQAQSNNAIENDTSLAPLRAPSSAPHRGR